MASALLVMLLSGSTLVPPDPPRPPRPGVKAPGVKIPIERLKPEAIFPVPGAPDWMAIGEAVWVSNEPKEHGGPTRPQDEHGGARRSPSGSAPCSGLAMGFGSLWVPNCGDQTLARVDLETGQVTATIPTGIADDEGGLATGAGSVWLLTDAKGTLLRLDPDTHQAVAKIPSPRGPSPSRSARTPSGSRAPRRAR